jgi:membrane-associated protease RseP (regulator of RpoE activity)
MNEETKRRLIQATLFIVTFITTTMAGGEWVYGKSVFYGEYSWKDFFDGMAFSVPLLLILTVHEFGHYFTAVYHKIKTSLPYYIPIPPIPFLYSFGTFGAVIRLREKPATTKQTFDIGVAGPVAGFVVAVMLLIYGFMTLPPASYIYQFHPEYEAYGANYADHVYQYDSLKKGEMVLDMKIGKSLIFMIAEQFVDDPSKIPNSRELMHYPVLFAVFFALFVTSINLLPIGQLDGGHVMYGLFGYKKHKVIASIFFVALMFYAGLGNSFIKYDPAFSRSFSDTATYFLYLCIYIAFIYIAFTSLGLSKRDTVMYVLLVVGIQLVLMKLMPDLRGYEGWLILGMLLAKLVGISHPPSEIEQPLDSKRIILGWISLLIFILCFSLNPLDPQVITGQ